MNRLQHAREAANLCASMCILIAFIAWCLNGLSTEVPPEQAPLIGEPTVERLSLPEHAQVVVESPGPWGRLKVFISSGYFHVEAPKQVSLPAMVYGAVK